MANFFKTIGKGILYVITLPLLLVFLSLYLVVSIIGFIIVGIKGAILFFKGENITGDLPEDIEAAKRMDLWLNPIPHLMEQVEKAQNSQNQIAYNQNPINDNHLLIANEPSPMQSNNEAPSLGFKEEPMEVKETKTAEFKEPDSEITPEEEISPTLSQVIKDLGSANKEEEITIENPHTGIFKEEPPSEENNYEGVTITYDDEEENK